jgi:hypothetical protein
VPPAIEAGESNDSNSAIYANFLKMWHVAYKNQKVTTEKLVYVAMAAGLPLLGDSCKQGALNSCLRDTANNPLCGLTVRHLGDDVYRLDGTIRDIDEQ